MKVRAINLRERVPANSAFEEGSLQVTYTGMGLELGGVVLMVDAELSLIFDEEFSEPAKDFQSSRLEGVWWLTLGGRGDATRSVEYLRFLAYGDRNCQRC
jgi:hypothetical protein